MLVRIFTYLFVRCVYLLIAAPQSSRRNYIHPLIVGGTEAIPNEFPFMLAMQYRSGNNYVHRCGASIINENWAMKASHCTEK